jgi:hypothetical protein
VNPGFEAYPGLSAAQPLRIRKFPRQAPQGAAERRPPLLGSCSARLQAGTLDIKKCPPEGGRYTTQTRISCSFVGATQSRLTSNKFRIISTSANRAANKKWHHRTMPVMPREFRGPGLLREAADCCRFRRIGIKHGNQLGYLQNFLKLRSQIGNLQR